MKRVKFMNISISELSMSGIFTEKPRKNGKKELSDKFRVLLEKGPQWKPIIHIYFERPFTLVKHNV